MISFVKLKPGGDKLAHSTIRVCMTTSKITFVPSTMPPTLKDDDHEDTIVVKGEFESHTSSPDSFSPETQPLTKNVLSAINPQDRLESPEPYDTPAIVEISNIQIDRIENRRPKANITTMEDRLQQMPELRPLPWRAGVEEGADMETGGESRRKQIRFGCLLATRGEVKEPGCNSCVNGRGKFSLCIALDGYFKGACASCQLSGRPNRCSIKKEEGQLYTIGCKTIAKLVCIEPASSHAKGTSNGETSFGQSQAATPSKDHRPSGPPRKRRRASEVKRANEAKRARLQEVPQWAPQPPPQPPLHQPVQWGQNHLPLPPLSQQLNEKLQKTWATVNQHPLKPQLPTNGNGHLPPEHYKTNTMSWATVNQPQPHTQTPLQPQAYPTPQTAPSVQGMMHNGGDTHWNGFSQEGEGRESTTGNEEGSGALIDSLPKSKQRQVYGLVSGLQGGIEHLQRQLDALKRAIGIDDVD